MTEVCAPTRRKFVLLNQKSQIKFLLLLFPLQPKNQKMLSIRWDCTKSSYHFPSSFFPVHKRFPCTFQTCQSDWFIVRNSLVRNWSALQLKKLTRPEIQRKEVDWQMLGLSLKSSVWFSSCQYHFSQLFYFKTNVSDLILSLFRVAEKTERD